MSSWVSPFSSSPSYCHREGSFFSSSPVGIMGATRSSSLPPILGGSALAIPPSVTREVQDVLSLGAPPLPIARALPLMVDSHLSLLGSSQDVSGGAASPSLPLLPLGLILQCVYCPHPICGCGACVSSSPSFDSHYPPPPHQVWK